MSPADKSWSATTHCRGIAVYVPSDILPVKSKLLRVVISLNMHGSLLTRNFISFLIVLCKKILDVVYKSFLSSLLLPDSYHFTVCSFQGTCGILCQVENTRFELVTSCLQGRRSPN